MRGALPVLVSVALFSGCSLTATMIPVEGPLGQRNPVPLIQAKADGIMGNSGNLTFTVPDGDACNGRWSSAAGAGVTYGTTSLLSQYGAVYGTGVAVSTGSGQNPGRALVTCASGPLVEVEFVTGAGTAHGFGIAKDSDGTSTSLCSSVGARPLVLHS